MNLLKLPIYDRLTIGGCIRGKLKGDDSFFCYRLPGASDVVFAPFVSVTDGWHPGGFIISDFSGSLRQTLTPCYIEAATRGCFTMPIQAPTSRQNHKDAVIHIREYLRAHDGGKCVLSRLVTGSISRPVEETFLALVSSRPDAFAFLFRTPEAGCWIGASPETLLRSVAGDFHTMSLAGTRPASSGDAPWDGKNLEEQKIVTDFILHTFLSKGIDVAASPITTRRAGPVEHILSVISGHCDFRAETLPPLLEALSPTPALGGFPRETALMLINRCELHSRGCYGGFCGPWTTQADFDLFVNLRSAHIHPETDEFEQYVGGGITRLSDPDTEWTETSLKALSLSL